MRGGAEPPSISDRRTSFGNTSASSSREGGLVGGAWRDAEARRSRADATAQRWRLVGLGAVVSTALLALASRADVVTPSNAIELGDARITDGGAWGFGADGTVGASVVGGVRDPALEPFATTGSAGAGIARHDASDAPDWVRRVAPFDDASAAAFDPVIDWADAEAERDWPLFGSEGEGRAERLDERTARVQRAAETGSAGGAGRHEPARGGDDDDEPFDSAAATPEQRRAARVRRRVQRRAAIATATARRHDHHDHADVAPRDVSSRDVSSLAQPTRDTSWRNPAGVRATFSVNVCGVPPAVRARQAPWPACRVLLVGCPGGRSAPDAEVTRPACASWDVSRVLEMAPEDAENGFGAFSVTTDMYGPGDEFAFALVKPGCTDAQIARALHAQASVEPSDGTEASVGFENGGCEVRLDSGFPMGNQLTHPGSRRARCWTPRDDTAEVQKVAGDALCESVGGATDETVETLTVSDALGDRASLSLEPFEARGDTCLLRRDAAYVRGKFHRVMPAFPLAAARSDPDEPSKASDLPDPDAAVLGSAVTASSTRTQTPPPRVSFVWGACDAQPRTASWCAPPAFDAARVAAACGAEPGAPRGSASSAASSSSSSLGAETEGAPGARGGRTRPPGRETDTSARRAASRTTGAEDDGAESNVEFRDVEIRDDAASKPASSMTREETKARAALRAAALRSKSEPTLFDDAATNDETSASADAPAAREAASAATAATSARRRGGSSAVSVSRTDAEDRRDVAVVSASRDASSASDVDASGEPSEDLFGAPSRSVSEVAPGEWTETPPTRLAFAGDAPKAVAHLLLREGDARFATERLPWAELIVNGEPARAPKQLARGDVVRLRVRA